MSDNFRVILDVFVGGMCANADGDGQPQRGSGCVYVCVCACVCVHQCWCLSMYIEWVHSVINQSYYWYKREAIIILSVIMDTRG